MILRTETRHRVDTGGQSGHDEAALVINIIASRPHLTQVYSAARLLCPMSHHYSGDPIAPLDLAAACALLLGAHMTNRHSMHNLQRRGHTFAT